MDSRMSNKGYWSKGFHFKEAQETSQSNEGPKEGYIKSRICYEKWKH